MNRKFAPHLLVLIYISFGAIHTHAGAINTQKGGSVLLENFYRFCVNTDANLGMVELAASRAGAEVSFPKIGATQMHGVEKSWIYSSDSHIMSISFGKVLWRDGPGYSDICMVQDFSDNGESVYLLDKLLKVGISGRHTDVYDVDIDSGRMRLYDDQANPENRRSSPKYRYQILINARLTATSVALLKRSAKLR